MDYLQYEYYTDEVVFTGEIVLNLVINGLPSIHRSAFRKQRD